MGANETFRIFVLLRVLFVHFLRHGTSLLGCAVIFGLSNSSTVFEGLSKDDILARGPRILGEDVQIEGNEARIFFSASFELAALRCSPSTCFSLLAFSVDGVVRLRLCEKIVAHESRSICFSLLAFLRDGLVRLRSCEKIVVHESRSI